METGPPIGRDRVRAEEEAASRRRKASLMAGLVGLGLLFGGGVVAIAIPGWILPLTGLMVVGVLLLVVAFLLATGLSSARFRPPRDR